MRRSESASARKLIVPSPVVQRIPLEATDADILPQSIVRRLVRRIDAMRQYHTWAEVIPAVTGDSADELEAGSLAHPRFARPHDRLGPIRDLQLVEDVGDVVACRLEADRQAVGNFLVG